MGAGVLPLPFVAAADPLLPRVAVVNGSLRVEHLRNDGGVIVAGQHTVVAPAFPSSRRSSARATPVRPSGAAVNSRHCAAVYAGHHTIASSRRGRMQAHAGARAVPLVAPCMRLQCLRISSQTAAKCIRLVVHTDGRKYSSAGCCNCNKIWRPAPAPDKRAT